MSVAIQLRINKVSKERQEAENALLRLIEGKRQQLFDGKDTKAVNSKIEDAKRRIEDSSLLEAGLKRELEQAAAREREKEIAERKKRFIETIEELIKEILKTRKLFDSFHRGLREQLTVVRRLSNEAHAIQAQLELEIPGLRSKIPTFPNMAGNITQPMLSLNQALNFLNFDIKHWLEAYVKPNLELEY